MLLSNDFCYHKIMVKCMPADGKKKGVFGIDFSEEKAQVHVGLPSTGKQLNRQLFRPFAKHTCKKEPHSI